MLPGFRSLILAGWLLLMSASSTWAVARSSLPELGQRVWQRTDGLPSDEISGLCQDSTGYLWVATRSGLARFDGARFRHYDFSDNGRTTRPGIAAIAAGEKDGVVWAAPVDGGLWRFNGIAFVPHRLPSQAADSRVARLLAASDGALWVCFEGGEVARLHEDKYELFGVEDGLIAGRSTQVAVDGQGRVWLAGQSQLWRYEAGKLARFPLPGVEGDIRIASARQDGPWVLGRGWLRKVVGEALPVSVPVGAGLNAYSVQALLEDSNGAIWTGTRSRGVQRHSGGDDELMFEEPDDIVVLFEDRAGNLWGGSNGRGLVRLRPTVARLWGKAQGLLDEHVLGVCEDRDGTLWVANRDGGVAFMNSEGRFQTLAAPPMKDTLVGRSVVPAATSGVWVATSHGLWHAERSGKFTQEGMKTPSGRGQLRVTLKSSGGDLWLAIEPTRLGRFRNGVWREFTLADGIGAGQVQAIAEDASGRIWIGTKDSRLYRQAGEIFEEVKFEGASNWGGVQVIHFDAANVGWIGTGAGGLIRLDDKGARALTRNHGLPSRSLSQIISDDFGGVWFGSPEGIFHVRRDELEKWFAGRTPKVHAFFIGADDGVQEAPCATAHQPSVWKGRDGRLWFATRRGVVSIDSRREDLKIPPLVVQVDAVRADAVTVAEVKHVEVPPLTHAVEFDFSILCLATPARVLAQVRLQGYDETWLPADARGYARYTRLPPGNYTFEIAAQLAGRPGHHARYSIPVTIAAAWWQTWWFRVGGSAVLVALAVVIVRQRTHRRLRARLAELERVGAIERERARIARNIHDDLGSGLIRISLLTQTSGNGDPRAQLSRIYATVSLLLRSMDEIVWAVNPKNDDLESLTNYIVEYAQGFLTDAGIRCRVAAPEVLPTQAVPAQFRHHLFLSCKEALNNVVKHARASAVTVEVRAEAGRLVLIVADDGCGFDGPVPSAGAARNGITNMRARLASLGGSCEVASCETGTTITFSAPIPAQPRAT